MADETKKTAVVPSHDRIGKPDWTRLIPALEGYMVPGAAYPEDYAHFETQIEVALGFTEFFWPAFVLVDDMVFRGTEDVSQEVRDNIAEWMKALGGDKSKVEQMRNHEHLIDLFALRSRPADNAQIEYLAAVVRDMWSAKLARDFPDRKFAVELYCGGDEPWNWVLTFFQQRSGSAAGGTPATDAVG